MSSRALTARLTLIPVALALLMPIPFPRHADAQPACPAAIQAGDDAKKAAAKSSRELTEAHQIATGAGIKVAVIDTGVSPHPRLGEVIPIADLVDPAANKAGAHNDCDGHGTVVAGIAAARPQLIDGRPTDIIGVAPEAQVLAIRQSSALVRTSRDGAGTLNTLAKAIDLAVDHHADVINVSVVSCMPRSVAASAESSQLNKALERAESAGTVVVAAAGNVGQSCAHDSVVFPAHSPTVLGVTASSNAYEIAEYSVEANGPLLSAPGSVIVGLSPRDDALASGLATQSGVASFEGTSFAAPYVAGTAALLKQRYPTETPAQIRKRIIDSAQPGTGHVSAKAALTHVPSSNRPQRSVEIDQAVGVHTHAAARATLVVAVAVGASAVIGVGWALRSLHRHSSS